jgi:hypothetical protein
MKRKHRLVGRERNPKENFPFPLRSKGEKKNKGMETERKSICVNTWGALVTGVAMVTGRE